MSHTYALPEFPESEKEFTPYRKNNRMKQTLAWHTELLTPASGVYSNVDDLLKLMELQLQAYTGGSNRRLHLSRNKAGRTRPGSFYGYGIFQDEAPRGTLYGHRGDMDGFASEYTFNPDKNVGVVLLPPGADSGPDYLLRRS